MGWLKKLFGPGKPHVQPVHVEDDTFDALVLGSDLPVLLDIWSPTCGPCRQLEPIIMDLASEYDGRVRVAELNSHIAPRTMQRLKVRGVPTVLYYVGGREVERVVGFRGSLYHRGILDALVPGEREDASTP